MNRQLNLTALKKQNQSFFGTGGRSQESRDFGFHPAFLDTLTGRVHDSRFAGGQPAPIHMLDGLPVDLATQRDATGRVLAVRSSVVAGFVRHGRFYSREDTRRWIALALDL